MFSLRYGQIECKRLWQTSTPLTMTAVLALVALVASVVGIFIDPRMITGVPAWVKPAKFAISIALYTATLAWIFRWITVWPRFVRAMGGMLSFVLLLELTIIDLQGARGVTSHFNVATPLDAALFQIMGIAIGLLWLSSVGVFAALCRQQFADRGWGWALRLGMLITVIGSALGGLMTQPTSAQKQEAASTGQLLTAGSHTVGGPDGGPGMRGLGWSSQHGDLRIPHFVGLHGIQMVPLLSWLLFRRRPWRTRLVFTIATSYATLVTLLTWQALRGQSMLMPDSETLIVFALWLAATVTAVLLMHRTTARETTHFRRAAAGAI